MSKIMYKGVEYADGTNYANEIQYDNSNSGLSSTDVQGAIDEILSDLADNTVTEFTPTGCTPLTNHGGCYYKKIGSFCIIHVAVTGLTADTQTLIFNLPENARPKGTYMAKGGNGVNELGIANLTVASNGDVYVTANSSIHALTNLFYIIK